MKIFLLRARKALAYLLRGDLRSIVHRLRAVRDERRMRLPRTLTPVSVLPGTLLQWCVMATPHTLFIGNLIARRLRQHGWRVTVTTSAPEKFDDHFYVVVCPQMFSRLPPADRRFVYQMEQSVSSRWFTKDYLNALRNSRAMLDYALANFEFMEQRSIAYPHTYYLPVGADPSYAESMPAQEKMYDVLFYGDAASSPRRRQMLETLEKHFTVHRCSEVFGDDMYKEIMRARVVVNLHYYENALLETPRIQECLSLGVPVVSESAQDQNDYPEISSALRFFPEGDEQAMIKAVETALVEPVPQEAVSAAVQASWERFCFMFDRFLVGVQMLPPNQILKSTLPLATTNNAARVVLSLPETIRRRRSYEENRINASVVFDGVRYSPGWIGCALSYATLARHALASHLTRLMVLEDDVLLSPTFETHNDVIQAYLDAHEGEWDVFAGVIADLHPDTRVLKVEHHEGLQFVTIDKMTSMVCNIYSQNALQLLAAWNPSEGSVETNTIDRYLENQASLRVVVILPFLASLKKDLYSTLWGIDNRRYLELIATTEKTLVQKVDKFLQGSGT